METSWHSWAPVQPEKSRLLSAVLAPHCSGVGVAPQFSWRDLVRHGVVPDGEPLGRGEDAVMTLDVVSRPPDAVMSWLTVTSVLAKPTYPAALMLTPSAKRTQDRVEDRHCWEVIPCAGTSRWRTRPPA